MKNIIILATGGTIAGSGESAVGSGYKAGGLDIKELINSVPNIDKIANIKAEQIANIGSQDMDEKTLIHLAKRANELLEKDEVDGIVVIHGTDTMEESAYFLNLTINTKKPIVFTGAMRSSTSISSDGAMNMLNAISVAACKKSRKKGVFVVMNDEIHLAREVIKTKTSSLNAFNSPNSGKIGIAYYGYVKFYTKSLKDHTYKSEFNIKNIDKLPRVDIIYSHLNDTDLHVKTSLKAGAKGIISVGFGNGNIFHKTLKTLHVASKKGVVVARSSRVGQGNISICGEIDDEKYNFITTDNLNPQKARILLMLGLSKTDNRKKLQKMFFRY